jgi:methionyl-tRNA formyltransferase
LRLAFFGSTRFSCLILAGLNTAVHELCAVVTQPDQPAGRHMELTATMVSAQAAGLGVPLFKPAKLRGDSEFLGQLASTKPDALLVASYGQILPRSILKLTPWPLNVHPSLLPKLRGASPIRTALLKGLDVTGCCIMKMTPRLDDGDVLLREELAIDPQWNCEQLETALADLGARLANSTLDQIAAGTAMLIPQNDADATYCSIYTREDTMIDWGLPAAQLVDFIRAWDPDIGATTPLPDGKRLKVWKAEAQGVHKAVSGPGEILAAGKALLAVACGGGTTLRLLEVQPENKRRMAIGEYLAGARLAAGQRLGTVRPRIR